MLYNRSFCPWGDFGMRFSGKDRSKTILPGLCRLRTCVLGLRLAPGCLYGARLIWAIATLPGHWRLLAEILSMAREFGLDIIRACPCRPALAFGEMLAASILSRSCTGGLARELCRRAGAIDACLAVPARPEPQCVILMIVTWGCCGVALVRPGGPGS